MGREVQIDLAELISNPLTRTMLCDAISDGIRNAFMEIMDAAGGHPTTRQEIIEAIRKGIEDAKVSDEP